MNSKKITIMILIFLLVLITGCESKKGSVIASTPVDVTKQIEPIDQQLNCSKDISDQLTGEASNIRLVNYLEMNFAKERLQDYSIIYDVTFGDNHDSKSIRDVVFRLEENFLSLYGLDNGKVIISTKEIAPKRYNIKTYISFKDLTSAEKEKINLKNVGNYETNLRAFESTGYICQTSI